MFKKSFFILMMLAPALSWADTFNCGELSGVYECGMRNSQDIIELNGHEITVLDDSELPISYKVTGEQFEAASEKVHVTYKGRCKSNSIEIERTVTPRTGEVSEPLKEVTKYTFRNGELVTDTRAYRKKMISRKSALCAPIKDDLLVRAPQTRATRR